MRYYILILSLAVTQVQAKPLEKVYQAEICTRLNGKTEVVNPDKTRIDCLTDEVAIEVDFAPKYAECFGQAALYASHTGKKPVCYLIINPKTGYRYIKRFNLINSYFHHKVELRTVNE